jgi:phosphatidylglycerol:prolipoprotein diacylglycerol transferase
MFPVANIGPLAIQIPGLILLAGVWIAINLVEREAGRMKLPVDRLSNMILVALVAGVLGARFWYAIRFMDVYLENPLSLISLNPATLATTEGILTGILAAVIFGQRKALSLWPTLDALTLGLAAMAMAIAISHLASGDAFGKPSEAPWAIDLWGEQRHPSQVYEILATGLIIWFIWRGRRMRIFQGFSFLFWVGMMGGAQLILEAFRGDSVIILETLRQRQVVGLVVLLGAMLGMYILGREAGEQRQG